MSSPLQVSGPAQLVAAVPYLIGFEPSNSVVAVFMRDSRVILTVRVDASSEVSQAVERAALACGADELAVLTYDTDETINLPGDLIVRDVIAVRGGRWRSLMCQDRTCCPPEGNWISQECRDAVAAAFVLDGVVPLPSRAALEESFRSLEDEHFAQRVALAIEDAVVMLGAAPSIDALRRWREDAADDIEHTVVDCLNDPAAQARCVVGLQDIRVRDVVLHRMADLVELRNIGEWLRGVAVVTPAEYAAAVYTLCAAAFWQSGDGARACLALEHACDLDPDYSLATLLFRAIQAGMPPATWRQALRDTSEEECLRGAA